MENIERVKNIIEALLIVSENGLTKEQLKNAINDTEQKEIVEALDLLKEEYSGPGRAFNIAEIAGKCRIVTKPEYMPWIGNLYEKEVDRLTGPSLETLAIIAYKQPATRAEVEVVRGVNVGGVIGTLLDKELIAVRGRRDVIGRPLVYGTTEKFLEIFGLNSLNDLPILREFSEEDLEYGKPQEVVSTEESVDESTGHKSQVTGENEIEGEAEKQEAEKQEAKISVSDENQIPNDGIEESRDEEEKTE